MWEEAQIKANVGLKHWSRLWLTQNKYINHWNLLRLSLDPSWSVSLWLQGCARRPCALSGALCESTLNKNSQIVPFQQGLNHSSVEDLLPGRLNACMSNRAVQLTFQRCEVFTQQWYSMLSSRQWLYVYTCPLEKTALLFSALMNVGSNKHPLTEEA